MKINKNRNSNLVERKLLLMHVYCWRQIQRKKQTQEKQKQKRKEKKKQVYSTYSAHTQTRIRNRTAIILIETPFKVDSSGLSVHVENYHSDPTTPCTIKTQACGLGAGIFMPCGTESYIHTDIQTEFNTTKKNHLHTYVLCKQKKKAECKQLCMSTWAKRMPF